MVSSPPAGSPDFDRWIAVYAAELALVEAANAEARVAERSAILLGLTPQAADMFAHSVRFEYEQRHGLVGSAIIHDPDDRPRPPGDLPLFQGPHWGNLRASVEPHLGERDFARVEKDALEIFSMLDPRGRQSPHHQEAPKAVDYRGLVIGQVQSGKTTSMQAVMALAADNGYSIIVVLSGNTNILRAQTQVRMGSQLLGRHGPAVRWFELTHAPEPADPNGDFGRLNPVRPRQIESQLDRGSVLMAVTKKNAFVLKAVKKILDLRLVGTKRVLIIDDEADLASVDANAGRPPTAVQRRRTSINRLIGDLIGRPNVAYVAYTATPYAILLSDPHTASGIFPSSFIWTLHTPADYIGPELLFGGEDDDNPDGQPPMDVLRSVTDAEATTVRQSLHDLEAPQCGALIAALEWFVLASACMWYDKDGPLDTTMLVHPSVQTSVHGVVKEFLKQELERIETDVNQGRCASLTARLAEEQKKVPRADGQPPRTWKEIEPWVRQVLASTRVVVDNYRSSDRLNYDDTSPPTPYVVVGGNTLSRGVTLRGLVSSYIVRTIGAVDTLLQAGRWFGYRAGYRELPRIWLPDDLRADFREAALVEGHLRRQLREYQAAPPPRPTPKQLPALLRTPMTMRLTGKMGFGATVKLDFSGAHNLYTLYFVRHNADLHRRNAELLNALLAGAAYARHPNGGRSYSDIPWASIDSFLFTNGFELWTGEGPWVGDTRDRLRQYILGELSHGCLSSWDVNSVGKAGAARSMHLDGIGELPLLTRTAMVADQNPAGTEEIAYIKTLRSRPDLGLGLSDDASRWLEDVRSEVGELTAYNYVQARTKFRPGVGLLNIYPIDRESTASPGSDHRTALGTAEDVIGIDLVLPLCDQGDAVDWTYNELLPRPYFTPEDEEEAADELEAEDDFDSKDQPEDPDARA